MHTTLSAILKEITDRAGLDADDLARRAGIKPSRAARILRGLTPPTADEITRICSVAGFEAGSLIEQVVEHHGLLLLLTFQRPCGLKTIPASDCRLFVDKLSLTFDVREKDDFLKVAVSVGKAQESKLYAHSFSTPLVLVQCGPQFPSMRSCRIEFNPDRLSPRLDHAAAEARSLLSRLMRTVNRDSIRITRIDVAVDLPVSINDVHGIGDKGRKLKTTYLGAGGIETIELGSPQSDILIKQYDKRRERSDRGVADPGTSPPLTRVEARLHRLSLKLGELAALTNPFRPLRLFLLRPDALPLDRRYLVAHARTFGMPDLQARLSPEQFKTVQRDLELSDTTPIVPHPRDVFDARWSDAAGTLLRLLTAFFPQRKPLRPFFPQRKPLSALIPKGKRSTFFLVGRKP